MPAMRIGQYQSDRSARPLLNMIRSGSTDRGSGSRGRVAVVTGWVTCIAGLSTRETPRGTHKTGRITRRHGTSIRASSSAFIEYPLRFRQSPGEPGRHP